MLFSCSFYEKQPKKFLIKAKFAAIMTANEGNGKISPKLYTLPKNANC